MGQSPFIEKIRAILRATQIYTHVIGQHSSGTISPLDRRN